MQLDPRLALILKKIGELDSGFTIEASHELRTDLAIDSLRLIDVVLAVEKEFGVDLDVDSLVQVQTAGDFQDVIEGLRVA